MFSKTFLLATTMAVGAMADNHCDFTTCLDCLQVEGCGWYNPATSGVTGNVGAKCMDKTKAAEQPYATAYNAATECPACQAGSCAKCQEQGADCAWYTNLFDSECNSATWDDTRSKAYTKADTCPTCDTAVLETSTCGGCAGTAGCYWLKNIATGSGSCSNEKGKTGYDNVPAGACDGNPCVADNCDACTGLNALNTSSVPCKWYASKLPSVYGPMCDMESAGTVDDFMYDAVEGECPKCSGTTCNTCNSEPGCSWFELNTVGGFGECKEGQSAPTGKERIAPERCSGACSAYSCKTCGDLGANCAWYTPKSAFAIALDPLCDFATDNGMIDAQTMEKPETCPACSAVRCTECASEEGCNWFEQKFTGAFGECVQGTKAPFGKELIDAASDTCTIASSAGSVTPTVTAAIVIMAALMM